MRTAHRRQAKRDKKNGKNFTFLLRLILPFLLIFAVFLYLRLNTNYWNGHDKVSVVYPNKDGSVEVFVFDPLIGEKINFHIPGDTEVEVARGYGQLRLKNVWQLGVNEKLNGELLAQTITSYFHFPLTLWSTESPDNTFRFIFSPGKTNIQIGDRILIAIFNLKINSIDTTEIDLAKNQYLKKVKLADGELGYVLNGNISSRLTVYFSDNDFTKESAQSRNLKFKITDATGRNKVADTVGEIMEVLGGKVVSIDRQEVNTSLDCEIVGKDKSAVQKVIKLFKCKEGSENTDFDVEILIGQKFVGRF